MILNKDMTLNMKMNPNMNTTSIELKQSKSTTLNFPNKTHQGHPNKPNLPNLINKTKLTKPNVSKLENHSNKTKFIRLICQSKPSELIKGSKDPIKSKLALSLTHLSPSLLHFL